MILWIFLAWFVWGVLAYVLEPQIADFLDLDHDDFSVPYSAEFLLIDFLIMLLCSPLVLIWILWKGLIISVSFLFSWLLNFVSRYTERPLSWLLSLRKKKNNMEKE